MSSVAQIRIPATYMRGGTSKGVFFRLQDLPPAAQVPGPARDRLFQRVIGSPDPYAAHIDGMGGATSSTSKCVILSKSTREGHDVDYLYGQISIDKDFVDWSGNCGNLSTAAGAFALHAGLMDPARVPENGSCTVRIWQANIGKTILTQPRAIGVAAGLILMFAIIPGMPVLPFLTLAGIAGTGAYLIKKHEKATELALPGAAKGALKHLEDGSAKDAGAPGQPSLEGGQSFETLISTDTFSVELGYGLLTLTNPSTGGDLLDRITGLRKSLAKELGLIVPPVAVRDNLELESNHYRFLLRGKQIAEGQIMPDRWLAMNVSNSTVTLKGTPTKEPVFGLDAVWVTEAVKKTAEINGYTVVDASSVMITHLSEILKGVADLLLDREDVQRLIDLVKAKNPTLINELLPDLVSVGLIQRVLKNLLKESIPIRNLNVILETIADFAAFTKNPDELSEQVRRRLGVYFVSQYETEQGVVHALTLEPRLDQLLATHVKRTQTDIGLMLDPGLTQHLLRQLDMRIQAMNEQGLQSILITSSEVRLPFKRFFEPSFPNLIVLSYQEFSSKTQIQTFGIIAMPNEMNPLQQETPERTYAQAT